MRLYPKKLRNLEDLKREKARLLKESRQLEKEDFFSAEAILGRKKPGMDGKSAGIAERLLDLLPISNPLVSLGVKMAWKLFSKKTKKQREQPPAFSEGSKHEGNKVKAIVVEVLGGYLKWKALELSYKGIRHLLKKRKDKE